MKEIISYGDFFRYYTLKKYNDRFFLHIRKEDEPNEEIEVTKEEAIDSLVLTDFCPSKIEILNLEDAGLLREFLVRLRLDVLRSETSACPKSPSPQ